MGIAFYLWASYAIVNHGCGVKVSSSLKVVALALLALLLLLPTTALPIVSATTTTATTTTAYDHRGERWFLLYSPDGQDAFALRYSLDMEFLIGASNNSTVYVTETVSTFATGQTQSGFAPDVSDAVLGNVTMWLLEAYSKSNPPVIIGQSFVQSAPIDVGFGQVFQVSDRYSASCPCADPAALYQLTLGYLKLTLSNGQTLTITPPAQGASFSLYSGGSVAYDSPSSLTMLPEYAAMSLPNLAAVQSPLVAQVTSLQAEVSSLNSQITQLQAQANADGSLAAQVSQLQSQVASLQSRVSALTAAYDQASANSTALARSLASLQLSYSSLQSNSTALASLLSQSRADSTALMSQLAMIKASEISIAGQLASAQANSTVLAARVANLEQNVSASRAEVGALTVGYVAMVAFLGLGFLLGRRYAKRRGSGQLANEG